MGASGAKDSLLSSDKMALLKTGLLPVEVLSFSGSLVALLHYFKVGRFLSLVHLTNNLLNSLLCLILPDCQHHWRFCCVTLYLFEFLACLCCHINFFV